jgi:3-oxoacyl-[acyl-carrier-protein] synthase II
MKRRVVVTGFGALSPLGLDAETTWQRVIAGHSGIGPIEHFDASDLPTRICGAIKAFDPGLYMGPKAARRFDPFIQYGVAAGVQAIQHAGLDQEGAVDPSRVGILFGGGIGGMNLIERNHQALQQGGSRKVSPFFIPGSIINMVAGQLSIQYGFTGPNLAMVTACTTGLHCIGHAGRIIAYGDADIMIAGGAECASTPLSMAGFSAAKALSTRNDEPEKASRPWDKDRDGFVLSDGAAAVVLESLESAQKRGVPILGEIIGFGMSGDAHHVTAPPPDGKGGAAAMAAALRDAGLEPEDVQYINAHGTSTPVGDLAETVAVKAVFRDAVRNVMISSTKSETGHMLGAAGAIETVFCIMALRDQIVPPTINLESPGEGCDLDYVPGEARQTKLEHAMCNSFGFGGTNGSLVVKRWPS